MTRRADEPTIAEIADLTRRLRALSAAGRDADPAERAAFLADKDALLNRVPPAALTNDGQPSDLEADRPSRACGRAGTHGPRPHPPGRADRRAPGGAHPPPSRDVGRCAGRSAVGPAARPHPPHDSPPTSPR